MGFIKKRKHVHSITASENQVVKVCESKFSLRRALCKLWHCRCGANGVMEGRKRKLNHPWSHYQGLALVRPSSAVTSQAMNRQYVSLVPRIRPKPRPRHGPYFLQNNNNGNYSANQGNGCTLANGNIDHRSPARTLPPYGTGYPSSTTIRPPCPPPPREDTVKLPQLPCCNDHPPQPPCIMRKRANKAINNALEMHKDTLCGDLFENFQRKQFVGSDFDEFDEIQNQLKAICFAKPELLTSTLTLTALNCSKIPLTEDDLLRKYQSLEILDKDNGMYHNKEQLISSRKKTNKAVVNNGGSKIYFPRNPLPFEKVFDISNAHKEGDTKRQKFTEVSGNNKAKTNVECQTEEIASLESWLVTTTSKKMGTLDSKDMKIKQVESTKKRKQKKTKTHPMRLMATGMATSLTPRPSSVNKEPTATENSSPFAWLDDYFITNFS